LIGLIAGIGVFLAKTALEITMAAAFSLQTLSQSWHLVRVVFGLEVLLRLLDRFLRHPTTGKPYCSLLSPLYFCSITPCFYLVLTTWRIPVQDAIDAGYFFPPIDAAGSGACGDDDPCQTGSSWIAGVPTSDLLDMWRIVDFRTISWQTVGQAIPTLISLILFSLIHVPINIPAFALSTSKSCNG
jgi:sulfate permease, SulP family